MPWKQIDKLAFMLDGCNGETLAMIDIDRKTFEIILSHDEGESRLKTIAELDQELKFRYLEDLGLRIRTKISESLPFVKHVKLGILREIA